MRCRWSPRVRRVIEEAGREAYPGPIGTGHLLLGMLSQPDHFGAEVFGRFGVTYAAAVGRVPKRPERLQEFSPRAHAVLVAAESLAARFGNPQIGEHHLALCLLREFDSTAFRVVQCFGVEPAEVEAFVERLLTPTEPDLLARASEELDRIEAMIGGRVKYRDTIDGEHATLLWRRIGGLHV